MTKRLFTENKEEEGEEEEEDEDEEERKGATFLSPPPVKRPNSPLDGEVKQDSSRAVYSARRRPELPSFPASPHTSWCLCVSWRVAVMT